MTDWSAAGWLLNAKQTGPTLDRWVARCFSFRPVWPFLFFFHILMASSGWNEGSGQSTFRPKSYDHTANVGEKVRPLIYLLRLPLFVGKKASGHHACFPHFLVSRQR